MKKKIHIPGMVTLLLLLAACGTDYTITTRINPDGSCEREMVARLDSSDLREDLFIIPLDSSWSRKTEMVYDSTNNKSKAVVTVRKKYASVQEMNKEFYQVDELTERPNARVNLTKKFRWFHTQYRYEETYRQQFPFRIFPISNYLTEQEVLAFIFEDSVEDSIYFLGKDSIEREQIEIELAKKFDNFISENIAEEFFQELIRITELSDIEFFKIIDLSGEKEGIFRQLKPCLTLLEEGCGDDDLLADSLLFMLDSEYHTQAFSQLVTSDSLAFKTFNRKLECEYLNNMTNDYENTLELPGALLNTNAQKVIDGMPNWNFEADFFTFTDYSMWAESKRTHQWAYIVTVLLIIISISLPLIRKRTK